MTVILICVALACFVWAVVATCESVEWSRAHDAAADFAEDCLAESRDERAKAKALDDKLADTERRWLQALVSKVCAEAELRGQVNPLPGVEPAPIADGSDFACWADELGGAS